MNIIVTDDDEGVTEVVKRYLHCHPVAGHAEITICHTMKETQEIMESGKRVYAIFLDLCLAKDVPPLTGMETIAMIPELKKKGCEHVFAISGYEQFRQASLAAGADEFLFKLGDMDTPKTFLEKVAKFFREARGPSPLEKQVNHLQKMIDPPQ
jgi:DNA-binding NarL/FixJ family response regulator